MQNPIVQQVVETLRGANNVLITVKNNPSVDELTAAIALTLILNHMNKHATTVFSGKVPSTIEFLQPEMAIETSTDSLRDFIIALDKSKADKLRYKVEDNVVRIFITPYRSSISEDDLEFSQGDFNVDVVVALGVLNNNEFDQAVVSHGQILHDATVVAINNQEIPNEVGAVSWQDQQASSISEMISGIADMFGADVIDSQVATALMTGIVSETDRFKNEKTTPQVLSISSMLMSAGANQQLIAEKLEHAAPDGSVQSMSAIPQDVAGQEVPAIDDVDPAILDVAHDPSEDFQKINIDEQGNINSFDATTSRGTLQQQAAPAPAQSVPEEPIQEPVQEPVPSQDPLHEPMQIFPQEPLPQDDAQEDPASSDRAYLTAPPSGSGEGDEQGPGEPSGLFGNSMHDVSREGQGGSQHPVLSHKQKTIAPMQDGSDAAPAQVAEEPAAPAPVVPPMPPLYEPPAAEEKAVSPVESNEGSSGDDSQTLEDIEKAVQSPHLSDQTVSAKPEEKVEDFLGTAQKPEPSTQAPAELPSLPEMPGPEREKKPDVAAPPAVPPPAPLVPDVLKAVEKDVADTVAAAPAVPPPMMPTMPQASVDQPQFYESDGQKSNPFLNPKK